MRTSLRVVSAILWAGVILVAAGPHATAEIDERKATAVKAAYLRYIAAFTTWPEKKFRAAGDPIVIGTLGDDRSGVVAVIRKRIESRGLDAQSRKVVVRQLPRVSSGVGDGSSALRAALDQCHLLFLGASERSNWPHIRSLVEGRAIVTVSEIGGFSRSRGMIELVVSESDRHVAMHIDLDAVREAGLRLSSQLLRLKKGVKIVRGAPDSTTLMTNESSPG